MIFELIQDYYNEVTGKNIQSALILSHQTFGDFARLNPHWHGILIKGGFDDVFNFVEVRLKRIKVNGNFVYLPISSTKQMTDTPLIQYNWNSTQ